MVKKLYREKKRTYNLILVEFELPENDGMETTVSIISFLKQAAPNIPLPYICCLTSYREYPYRNQAYAAGVDTFMTKPIFKAAIQSLLIKAKMI